MAIKRTSHAVYDTRYHLVWCPKYGKKIFDNHQARKLFRVFPSLKHRLWFGQLWEDGYYARTARDCMTRDVIEKYIENHRNPKQGFAQFELKLR